MKSALQLTAAASLLAMFSLGAAAAPTIVSLDFDKEGDQALGNPPSVPSGPVKVEYVSGITFSGAWAYKFGMFKAGDVVPSEIDQNGNVFTCGSPPLPSGGSACNESGYISNRDRPSNGGSILTLTLDPSVYVGLYIKSLSFDIWHNGDPSSAPISIRFVDKSTGTPDYQDWLNISAGDKLWSTPAPEAVGLPKATSIEFDFGASALGLDNLKITVDGPGAPPPSVPEPGSYALVGLALLAAGAARRRKT